MAEKSFHCFGCGKSISYVDSVGFRDECEHCGEDSHVCKNCAHYDSKVYNECKETSAEVVREKERNNYCDYFVAGDQSGASKDKKEDLLSAAEALFGKKN